MDEYQNRNVLTIYRNASFSKVDACVISLPSATSLMATSAATPPFILPPLLPKTDSTVLASTTVAADTPTSIATGTLLRQSVVYDNPWADVHRKVSQRYTSPDHTTHRSSQRWSFRGGNASSQHHPQCIARWARKHCARSRHIPVLHLPDRPRLGHGVTAPNSHSQMERTRRAPKTSQKHQLQQRYAALLWSTLMKEFEPRNDGWVVVS
jgi:hypothetical protein